VLVDSDGVLNESLGPDTLEARHMVLDACCKATCALDTLEIPATATDCERTFRSDRKLINPGRNHLSDDIIKATECLKAWWNSDIIK
jgi:hypothetical protein